MAMFEKVNSKVVSVHLGNSGPVVARRGSMLFYSGDVNFAPHQVPGAGGAPMGGAIGGMVGSMMRGEHERTMIAQGSGQVHYGFQGLAVHVIDLPQGGQVTADMSRLLAYTAGMQASIVSTQSQQGGGGGLRGALRGAATGALTGNGMFTTQLQGVGAVVVLAHGELIELQVGNGPVVVDPQAFVGTIGNVQTQLQSAMGWRDAVGRGSGEAMQLQCHGQGVVLVQASEEKL
ncbi:AIM24 family protein [Yimella sp. cx-51]|uniref:AIM24 family protein n=1 Tax=Yimella sp. cx-51 TaxID=2770551 RepID=UPI001FCB2C7E|nr:AIM24 family protein [Yimella sp. cx-51]